LSTARASQKERNRALFIRYLRDELPSEHLVPQEGAVVFACAASADLVRDYFAAYGAAIGLDEPPRVLFEAWIYLSAEPGNWAAYRLHHPSTYDLLTRYFTAGEHAYIAAIAGGDRHAAARLWPTTRWARELSRKLALWRAEASRRVSPPVHSA
jgi:hypothetical protein